MIEPSTKHLHAFIGLAGTDPGAVPNVDLESKGAEMLKKHPHLLEVMESIYQPVADEMQLTRERVRMVAERLVPRLVDLLGKQSAQAAAQKGDTTGMGLANRG